MFVSLVFSCCLKKSFLPSETNTINLAKAKKQMVKLQERDNEVARQIKN